MLKALVLDQSRAAMRLGPRRADGSSGFERRASTCHLQWIRGPSCATRQKQSCLDVGGAGPRLRQKKPCALETSLAKRRSSWLPRMRPASRGWSYCQHGAPPATYRRLGILLRNVCDRSSLAMVSSYHCTAVTILAARSARSDPAAKSSEVPMSYLRECGPPLW